MTEKDYQKTILDNLPFIAYLKDLDGRIIEGNSKLSEYWNIQVKQNILSAFEAYEYKEMFNEDEYIIKNKKSLVYERKLKPKNKEEGWYRVIKTPIFNSNNEVVGITVFLNNIDNERKIEARKETFVATLTHDLKTPTIAQIRIIELLLNDNCGKISEEQKEMLEQMLKSCKYMLNMISQVLNTYKFEHGQARLSYEEFDFRKLMEESIEELASLVCDKNLKLKIKVTAKNTNVMGDKIQLKRVLINMIANSISYAYKNTEIELMLEEEEEMLAFYTKNSSPYIPSEILGKLFNKYVSNSSGTKFNKIGTGLGLYLSERIIAAHNGSIIAHSSEENKNTFGFKIPKADYRNIIQGSTLAI